MKFFPNALRQFEFDPDSAELTLEKVELPVSIGSDKILSALGIPYQSRAKTFLV